MPFSWGYTVGGDAFSLASAVAMAYEKFGRIDDALAWAERIATFEDVSKGGNASLNVRLRGLRIQGRCLAAKGQLDEAEATLCSSAEGLASIGFHLGAVLSTRELFCCVMVKTGREAEGKAQLRAAVCRLVGEDAAEEDLDILAHALGAEVDLAAILHTSA